MVIKNQIMKMLPIWAAILMLSISKNTFAQTLFFERVYDESLAQASYVIGDKETRQAIGLGTDFWNRETKHVIARK